MYELGDNATERQKEFLKFYEYNMPVCDHDCIMNKICRRFEKEFDGWVGKHRPERPFDYTVMKSDAEYTQRQFSAIKRLYEEYNRRLASYAVYADYERIDDATTGAMLTEMDNEFRRECDEVCADSATLSNIILDLCYTKRASKRFAWTMCGSEIVNNLLKKNGYTLSYPTSDENGDIQFKGNRFSVQTIEV